MAPVTNSLRFLNARGFRLAADIVLPPGPGPFPAVVFAHDLLSTRENPAIHGTAEMLARSGIAAMLLDFTGHGDSEGTLEDCTLEQQVEGLGAALDELERRPETDPERIGGVGVGTGALAMSLRAERDPRIRVLALWAPTAEATLDAIRRVPLPTLLVVGSEDREMLQGAMALQDALAGQKEVLVVAGAGRSIEGPAQLEGLSVSTVEWFLDHLAASRP